jgi:hypothetical protein
MKKLIVAIIVSWFIFIGVDFLFHASIFESLWKEDIPALKSLENLALLIPAGYFSFLLLTTLIGYIFYRLFPKKPAVKEVLVFAILFATLYSLSNLFGLYSYVEIPMKQLIAFQFVYFVEIMVVSFSLNQILFSNHQKKAILISLLIFISLLISGIIIQNIGM